MSTEICFEILYSQLREYKNLANNTKNALIKYTTFYVNDKEIKSFKIDKIYELMLVNRLYQQALVYLNKLITDYKNNKKQTEKIENFYESFSTSNKEFNISFDEFKAIFNRTFKVTEGNVDLDSFFGFYEEKNYSFIIKNQDFIDLSLNTIISEHSFLLNNLNCIFDHIDMKKIGIIYLKEFEELLSTKIFLNTESHWKYKKYFM